MMRRNDVNEAHVRREAFRGKLKVGKKETMCRTCPRERNDKTRRRHSRVAKPTKRRKAAAQAQDAYVAAWNRLDDDRIDFLLRTP